MNHFYRLIRTSNDRVMTLLRITLGVVFFAHGSQKVLGWFGGTGYAGTMEFFTGKMGIPGTFAFLAILAEFAGSLGLILGLLSRVAAFGIACVMVVAVALVHRNYGFFMNWFGNQAGEGFEFHILALGLCLAVMVRGAGAASIDLKITEYLEKSLRLRKNEGGPPLRRVA